jgi:hypothetical protein
VIKNPYIKHHNESLKERNPMGANLKDDLIELLEKLIISLPDSNATLNHYLALIKNSEITDANTPEVAGLIAKIVDDHAANISQSDASKQSIQSLVSKHGLFKFNPLKHLEDLQNTPHPEYQTPRPTLPKK